ncbi:MAG TPA: ABC transporter permease [Candidatus Cybelea sp.]|nr:ABC transporter permease [Candidatus Cybelea sp.]
MSLARKWLRRLGETLGRDRRERELAAEMESHLAMHIEDNLRAGMNAQEARRQALIKLGGLEQTKELVRESRGLPMLEVLVHDLRYGARMLAKNPGFTFVATLTLALGIAANATIFSFVSAVMLKRPPVAEPDQLAAVSSISPVSSWSVNLNPFSAPNFFAWKKQSRTFADMAAADPYASASLTGDGDPERVSAMRATANYFSVLGVSAQLGRTFADGEDRDGRDHEVILSHDLWERRFAADSGIVGKTILLNSAPYQVIGVMPAQFLLRSFPAQIWIPLVLHESQQSAAARENRNLFIFARLGPGVTIPEANAEFQRLAHAAELNFPDTEKGWGATVLTLQDHLIREFNAGPAIILLTSTVGFVLLIACANIAGLLLARATGRGKEIAVRIAMGAGRLRMVRQLLTEALLLAALGGAAGLILTFWGTCLLKSALSFNEEVRGLDLNVDVRVLGFTAGISLLAAIVFGLVPALKSGTSEVSTILKNASAKASAGRRQNRLRSVLVTAEIALAVVLLTGTGLLITGLIEGFSKGLGFDQKHLLTASLSLSDSHYPDGPKQTAFYRQLLANLENLPGAESSAISTVLPSGGYEEVSFRLKGQENLPPGERSKARYIVVSPTFFDTAKIPLIRGRVFSKLDGPGIRRTAVVSEVFARRFFPKEDPLGRQVMIDTGGDSGAQWREVIGIVGNVKSWPLQTSDDPEIYENYLQQPAGEMAVLVRTKGSPESMAPRLRQAVWSIDKEQPVARVMSIEDRIGEQTAGDRLFGSMLGIFAALAVTLSAVGLYGLVAFTTGLRTQEIGIRMTLGADKYRVLRLVLGDGMKLALTGIAVGMIAALPMRRILEGIIPDFRVDGSWILPLMAAVIGMVALFACYIPARRATRVDPMAALRYE